MKEKLLPLKPKFFEIGWLKQATEISADSASLNRLFSNTQSRLQNIRELRIVLSMISLSLDPFNEGSAEYGEWVVSIEEADDFDDGAHDEEYFDTDADAFLEGMIIAIGLALSSGLEISPYHYAEYARVSQLAKEESAEVYMDSGREMFVEHPEIEPLYKMVSIHTTGTSDGVPALRAGFGFGFRFSEGTYQYQREQQIAVIAKAAISHIDWEAKQLLSNPEQDA